MKEHTCRDCGTVFSWNTGKPGRPPVRCEECRVALAEKRSSIQHAKVKTTLSSIERVDRLEANLKSRGLHPSQNQDEYN